MLFTSVAADAAAVNLVEIFSNYFAPQQIAVEKGETVTWVARDGGHTVTANDGRFDLPGQSTLARGQTAEWTFTEDETVFYRCKVHAPAMFGVIVVGSGDPPPPPVNPPAEERVVPSEEFPTIGDAIRGAPPRSLVSVAPGTHRGPVVVDVPELTIRGTGEAPSDVRLEGAGAGSIAVRAPGVRIENMMVTGASAGVRVDAGGYAIERVHVLDGDIGIAIEGVRGGTIHDVRVAGAARAGVLVRACDPCDVFIRGLRAERSRAGFVALDATGVVVHDSVFESNGVGVSLKAIGPSRQAGAHLWRNTFIANDDLSFEPEWTTLDIAVGAGIWIAGGSFNTIEQNTVHGSRYGIVVSASTTPSLGNRVVGNTIGGSGIADLGWDGLGAHTCFEGNGHAVSSEPPSIEMLYPCARATAGIPYPKVTADLLSAGL